MPKPTRSGRRTVKRSNPISPKLVAESLFQLGYIQTANPVFAEGRLSPEVTRALHDYGRRFLGDDTPIQGVGRQRAVAAIIDLLEKRQCGVPDVIRSVTNINAYGQPGNRWRRGNLTYYIRSETIPKSLQPALGVKQQEAVAQVMDNVFRQWEGACPFFKITPGDAKADIIVQFVGPDVVPKFKSGSYVGNGQYPESGELSFKVSTLWSANLPPTPPNPGTANLLAVALHEAGHILGISHSTSRASIMYPISIDGVRLDPETIRAIQNLYGWLPQQSFADRASTDGPSLAVAGTTSFTASDYKLFMAWRGIDGDSRIFWSVFGGQWSPQEVIEGIGSSHGPAIAASSLPSSVGRGRPSNISSAASGFGTGLFMAWKGVDDDTTIWFSQNPDLSGWTPQRPVPDVGTSCRPALCEFDGKMHMAWKGVPGDHTIWWSTFDGDNWTPQQEIRGRGTSAAPALAVLGNRLYMIWKGIPGDSRVFYAWLDNTPLAIWQAQQEVTFTIAHADGNESINIGTSHHPSATGRGNSIVLAWKGVPGDSSLWFAPFQDGEWFGQISMKDAGTSSGPAIAELDGRLYIVWKGIEDDSGLYWSSLG